MAIARVVTFGGVTRERVDQLAREIEEGERPRNIPATEILMLHDPDAAEATVILFFENEDDYRVGDETLSAMPSDETPGARTAVRKYDVAGRSTA
jgi:hypothetical protein